MTLPSQFRALRNHFFNRFFDSGTNSDGQDEMEGLVHRLALVATPGLMLPLLVLSFGPTLGSGPGLHYFLVSFSMVVTGIVMASKWDRLLPDRADYRILTSLPLTARDLFLARVGALVRFVSLYILAANAFPLLMAAVFSMMALSAFGWTVALRTFGAYALATIGGAAFVTLAFAALHGVLINLLPPSVFRKVSPRIQAASTAVLIGTFMVTPLVAGAIAPIAESGSRLFDFFPMAWFTGLYETVSPAPAVGAAWERWSWLGIAATGVVGLVAVLAYALGYSRHAGRMMESMDSAEQRPGVLDAVWLDLSRRTILSGVYERAVYIFIGKAARRSAIHRMWIAAYTGTGIALALSSVFVPDTGSSRTFPFLLSDAGVLEAPLVVSFLLVTGTRVAFRIPHEWKARWIFEFTDASPDDFVRATRKWVLWTRVVPLYAAVTLFELALFDPITAAAHVLFDLGVTWLLVEICFFDFRTVPYTSPQPVRKLEVVIYGIAYWALFSYFVDLAVRLQQRTVNSLSGMLVFVAAVVALSRGLAIYSRRNPTAKLLDFRVEPELQELKLS